MKPEIVVADRFLAPVMERLAAEFDLRLLVEGEDEAAFLRANRDRARAIAIASGSRFRASDTVMAALPKLEIIATGSVGLDRIDLAAAKARGVAVTNTPDVLTEDVADLGIALYLAVVHSLVRRHRALAAGQTDAEPALPPARVRGATMGIVGLGRIGLAVARRAEALGMRIAYHGPRAKSGVPYEYHADLAAMAAACHCLMVTCPGGQATRGLVSARVLEAVGPAGIVVNISRGSVIDEDALVAGLAAGRIGGAGIDVFVAEPQVPARLLGLDNVVLQPHVGSATVETRTAMGMLVVDNLLAHFAGRPLLTPVA